MIDPGESVVIHNFWPQTLIFHARHDPGTRCDPENLRDTQWGPCGHALPRRVAEKIARPCRKCYP